MKELPAAFIEEMQELFDTAGMTAEWPAFLQSLQGEPQSGLRANTLKIEFDSLRDLIAEASKTAVESIKCVSWTNDGLYCPSDFQPGLFPVITPAFTTFRNRAPCCRHMFWQPNRTNGFSIFVLRPEGSPRVLRQT